MKATVIVDLQGQTMCQIMILGVTDLKLVVLVAKAEGGGFDPWGQHQNFPFFVYKTFQQKCLWGSYEQQQFLETSLAMVSPTLIKKNQLFIKYPKPFFLSYLANIDITKKLARSENLAGLLFCYA